MRWCRCRCRRDSTRLRLRWQPIQLNNFTTTSIVDENGQRQTDGQLDSLGGDHWLSVSVAANDSDCEREKSSTSTTFNMEKNNNADTQNHQHITEWQWMWVIALPIGVDGTTYEIVKQNRYHNVTHYWSHANQKSRQRCARTVRRCHQPQCYIVGKGGKVNQRLENRKEINMIIIIDIRRVFDNNVFIVP